VRNWQGLEYIQALFSPLGRPRDLQWITSSGSCQNPSGAGISNGGAMRGPAAADFIGGQSEGGTGYYFEPWPKGRPLIRTSSPRCAKILRTVASGYAWMTKEFQGIPISGDWQDVGCRDKFLPSNDPDSRKRQPPTEGEIS
ncbi:hypothetical protein FOZ60_015035, partial [Perkinsus olseni]